MVLTAAAASSLSSLAASPTQQRMLQKVLQLPRGGAAAAVFVPPLLLLGIPDYYNNNNNNKKSAAQLANNPKKANRSLTSLATWWYTRWPSYVRYFVSGNLGNVFLYVFERGCTAFLDHYGPLADATPVYRASLSFFLAYWLHIPFQHLLHALLVYGLGSISTSQKYWTTLVGMCSALAVASVGSTSFNTLLLAQGVNKNVAFFVTLYGFSIFNYFVIGFIVQRSSGVAAAAANNTNNKATSRTR